MDQEDFVEFANKLATGVQKELELRGIPSQISEDKEVKPRQNGVHQVSVIDAWPPTIGEDFAKELVREMGIKLSRPFPLTTFEMVLPRGVTNSALGFSDGLVLRCICDYAVGDDRMILRVDALAKWME